MTKTRAWNRRCQVLFLLNFGHLNFEFVWNHAISIFGFRIYYPLRHFSIDTSLLCKPWKINGYGKNRLDAASISSTKRNYFAKQDLKEYHRL
jgi:hypothetical protein